MAEHKALADALTTLVKDHRETEFAHFLILNEAGNVVAADAGSATPSAAGYEPNPELASLLRGDFFRMAKGIAAFRGSSKLSIGSGEFRACMLSFENWIVTIRYLAPGTGSQKFLLAINSSPFEFEFGAARRAIDKATKLAEEHLKSAKST